MRLTDHEWATAQTVCTTLELQALEWWRQGAGYKRLSLILGISPSTARDRVHRATTKTARAVAATHHPTHRATIRQSREVPS